MTENMVPIQDVLDNIEWVDSWLTEMGLTSPALSTYHVLISVLCLYFYHQHISIQRTQLLTTAQRV